MKFYSLNGHPQKVSFKEAVIQSIAPDKGLFFPEKITPLPKEVITNFKNYSKEEIAYLAIEQFVGKDIPKQELQQIIKETIDFDFPLVHVEGNIHTMELFHGPTAAFKDVGARFMARCLGYFNQQEKKKITVLVATSGDTGGAVADGFFNVDGVEVVILYPKGKVSVLQEKQLTTLGSNIKALEVNGTFDDCQRMVKEAFLDVDLKYNKGLTSANSINVARWLPQLLYYIFTLQQVEDNKEAIISVPSGNFGNICAGMVAYKLGFPISRFVASTNINDVVPRFLETGKYTPLASHSTISNAMDVGDPSNFVRILELFGNDLKTILSAYSFTDQETSEALKYVFETHEYLMDTHGAVGYLGLKKEMKENKDVIGIFMETAHPAKFEDAIEPIIGQQVEIPTRLQGLLKKDKKSVEIEANFKELKQFLEL